MEVLPKSYSKYCCVGKLTGALISIRSELEGFFADYKTIAYLSLTLWTLRTVNPISIAH